jgi:nitrate reductase gamma subunit
VQWGRTPVPFRIPTTCGQQKSFPWIKHDKFENPSTTGGVIVRMLLEVFAFRSLFRNTRTDLKGDALIHRGDKLLWFAGLVFHWSFLIVLVRHIRLFSESVPFFVRWIESLDGFLQIGVPVVFMTGIVLLLAATYLFIRRVIYPQIRYISLPADYFPLFLIIGIALSGIAMRYFLKVDVVGVKEMMVGLFTLQPVHPDGIGPVFYLHIFLVSLLFAYFPFSKLMHMAGVFFSPTRNMANTNRMVRHINPWDYPVKVHTYEEYEDHFREIMIKKGIPVEKDIPAQKKEN